MPCLNEAETLATCIGKRRRLHRAPWSRRGEIVVADNGSTDGSQAIAAERAGARVVADVGARLRSRAVSRRVVPRAGASSSWATRTTATTSVALDAFVEKLREGADLVMGNRFLGGIRPGAMPWKNRYIGNPVLSSIGRLFFQCPARDFHCGLRGFTEQAFDCAWTCRRPGMEFASEMVIKATLLRLRIVEVPTTLDKDGREPASAPAAVARRLAPPALHAAVQPALAVPLPGRCVLIVVGLVVGAWLLPGPIMLVAIGWARCADAAALRRWQFCLGVQGVTFALCARIYALNEGLLPEDATLERMFRDFTLETGLAAGAILLVAWGRGRRVRRDTAGPARVRRRAIRGNAAASPSLPRPPSASVARWSSPAFF